MNNLIKINNKEIVTKEFKGQRVVTLADIDTVHERPSGTARRNFNENKDRLVEGEDYIVRNSYEAKKEFGVTAPNGLTLITEQGYLMIVKSFTDDLAWDVQRQLVNTYFRAKKPLTAIEQLQLTQQALLEVNEKIDDVADELQSFKKDMPLLAIECDRITTAVKTKGVKCLGGKDSNAYQDRGLRARVYSDIHGQLKREFGVSSYKAIKRSQCDYAIEIVNNYRLPLALEEEIKNINSQIKFKVVI